MEATTGKPFQGFSDNRRNVIFDQHFAAAFGFLIVVAKRFEEHPVTRFQACFHFLYGLTFALLGF
ncbi:MAG: hypothetical protein CMI09_03385 [Oceanospirillaceae bacterium]|nr:hypothetical protein [Oceanospirillaceae bacterium]